MIVGGVVLLPDITTNIGIFSPNDHYAYYFYVFMLPRFALELQNKLSSPHILSLLQ
jgi:hypothetical protein